MTVDTLYFHNLPRAHEGCCLISDPPSLVDLLDAQSQGFVMDDDPAPLGIEVVGFVVTGPERVDRYGLMVWADALSGSIADNLDSIRRTMPDGWQARARTATV